VIPQKTRPITLQQTAESIRSGSIGDRDLLASSEFYLAVRSEVGEDKVIREIPIKAKVSSSQKLPGLIAAAVRGVPMRHLPNPPTDVFEPGRTYFQLEKGGEHWDAVCRDGSISVYVPPEFTGLRIELMAVSE
jgi:type VI secretion system protein ImpJ